MNESVKEFIVDLLNGNGYLDLEELQKTEYDMEKLVNYVCYEFGEEELNLSSLMFAVLQMAKRDFIEEVNNYLDKIEDEYNKEDIDKIRTIDFGIEDDWELWASGLDNGIFFRTESEELCELVQKYLEDLIDKTSNTIGFTDLRIE